MRRCLPPHTTGTMFSNAKGAGRCVAAWVAAVLLVAACGTTRAVPPETAPDDASVDRLEAGSVPPRDSALPATDGASVNDAEVSSDATADFDATATADSDATATADAEAGDASDAACGSRMCGTQTFLGCCASCGTCSNWANWPMPNPVVDALPNPTDYDIRTAVVVDRVTGLMWERAPDNVFRSPLDAKLHCEALRLEGHSDWRLPAIVELVSIVDTSIASPAPPIDPTAFPGTVFGPYWSSTPSAAMAAHTWAVPFNGGVADQRPSSTLNPARCVR